MGPEGATELDRLKGGADGAFF